MSKEYTQALDDLFGLVAFQKSLTKEQFIRVQNYIDIIEPALQRLEAIDNANPSEALAYIDAFIEENNSDIKNQDITGFDIDTQAKWVKYLEHKSSMLSIIKQALIQAEQDKKKLNEIEKLTYLLYSERRKIGQEYVKWCKENNTLFNDETNMITWVLAIKLKEWLK